MPCQSAFLTAATLAALAVLSACTDKAEASADPPAASNSAAWTIGPIIRGRNYSVGAPLHPAPRRGGGLQIDLPLAPGSVHYVTFRHGSLAGKRRIVMRYRVETARGAGLVASSDGRSPSMITLYFQRLGDNWSGRGRFETYRWYATFATQTPMSPGDHVIVAPLDGAWTAVETSKATTSPAAFREAVADWKTPSENLIYADTTGDIGWVVVGAAPRRPNWD
ncbi:MAG: penicillin acylase family protein, partial [Allosphingosinicella sp.]